jgi:enterochelin esterase-like enzyme
MKHLLITLFAIIGLQAQELPKVVSGSLERLPDFKSNFVTSRNIDIWLPEGYSISQKYAVLYMHDGQMLYDATTTWNKQAWEVDDVMTELLIKGALQKTIVVGIWNGGETRHVDYFPQKPFEQLTTKQQDSLYQVNRPNGNSVFNQRKVQSDKYLEFLVKELKPYIDSHYAVYTDVDHTFIAGSSMGGLISMYALCEYPKVFGGAACLSTHWPGVFSVENNPIPEQFILYLKKHLPKANSHKIYFDFGTATLDAYYEPFQKQVDAVLQAKGWDASHWITRKFEGEDHSEQAWHKRLAISLTFLLGN